MTAVHLRQNNQWRTLSGGRVSVSTPATPGSTIWNGWDVTSWAVPPELTAAQIEADPKGTTGIPPNTTLTVVNGDYHTTANNQRVDALDVRGILYVDHPGVVVKRCKAWRVVWNGKMVGTHAILIACELNGGEGTKTAPYGESVYWSGSGDRTIGFEAYRCHLHSTGDGVKAMGNCALVNNWIGPLWYAADTGQSSLDTHNDCVQVQGGSANYVHANYGECWTYSPSYYGEHRDPVTGHGPHFGDTTHDWDGGPNAPAGSHVAGHTYHGKQTSFVLAVQVSGYAPITNLEVSNNIFHGLTTKHVHVIANGLPFGGGHKVINNVAGTENRDYTETPPQWLATDQTTTLTRTGNTWSDGTTAP